MYTRIKVEHFVEISYIKMCFIAKIADSDTFD